MDGRVYLGGGDAGVFCVDTNRLTLDGKEQTAAAIQKLLDAKWADLQAQYEKDKKEKPDFAIPPTEDQLPKPAPVKLWEQGKGKWHVDAPVAVADGLVLAASAFLDKEKIGDRALFALDAKTGAVKWRVPLKINPWGGPAVIGKTVVVTGSTVNFSPTALKGAKGEVAAYDLATGQEKWHKDVPGGVLACPALTPDLVVVTATDGKVRAFGLADGESPLALRRQNAVLRAGGVEQGRGLRRRPQGDDPRHQPRGRHVEMDAGPRYRRGGEGARHDLRRPGAARRAAVYRHV